MTSELAITLDQGFSTTFADQSLRIRSAAWQLNLRDSAGLEKLQRALLLIDMDPTEARRFADSFEPIGQALDRGRTRYRLELAPDAREALNQQVTGILGPTDWLSVADHTLMRLENYIYLMSLPDQASQVQA